MLNKKNLKSLFAVVLSGTLGISLASAVTIKMDISGLTNKTDSVLPPSSLSHIHFVDNGNDFGGVFYFSNFDSVQDNCGKIYGEGATSREDEGYGELSIVGTIDGSNCYCKSGYRVSNNFCEFDFTDTTNGIVLQGDDKTYLCSQEIKGVYYNAERGERLWPLDKNTMKAFHMDVGNNKIEMDGSLYTACYDSRYSEGIERCSSESAEEENYTNCISEVNEKYKDTHGIYGYVQHVYKGVTGMLVAGVEYGKDETNPWINVKSNSKLTASFQRFENKYPVGFVYDTNGGLGFVGCEFTGNNKSNNLLGVVNKFNTINAGEGKTGQIVDLFTGSGRPLYNNGGTGVMDCENIGSAANSLLNFVVEGLMKIQDLHSSMLDNQTSAEKTQTYLSETISNGDVINQVQRKTEILCRKRWDLVSSDSKIVCISGGNVNADLDVYSGKTLIVHQGDVEVSINSNKIYDIFIDGGYLIINNELEGGATDIQRKIYSKQGFAVADYNGSNFKITEAGEEDKIYNGHNGVSVGVELNGTFVINGLIKGKKTGETLKDKYFIHGKLISLNSYADNPDAVYEAYVHSVMGDRFSGRNQDIYIPKVFTWACNMGRDVLGIPCPVIGDNPYLNAALSIIDQDYDSILLKN